MGLAVFAMIQSVSFADEANAQMHRRAPLPTSNNPVEVRKSLDRFARCTAKGQEDVARLLVMSDDTPPDIFKNGFLRPECVTGVTGLRLLPDALRGPIAEYLIDEDFGGAKPLKIADQDNNAVIQVDAETARSMAESDENEILGVRKETYGAGRILRPLGECLLAEDQAGVIALLESKVGRKSEGTAAVALRPALERCTDAGATLAIDITALRAASAISYYRAASRLREE